MNYIFILAKPVSWAVKRAQHNVSFNSKNAHLCSGKNPEIWCEAGSVWWGIWPKTRPARSGIMTIDKMVSLKLKQLGYSRVTAQWLLVLFHDCCSVLFCLYRTLKCLIYKVIPYPLHRLRISRARSCRNNVLKYGQKVYNTVFSSFCCRVCFSVPLNRHRHFA